MTMIQDLDVLIIDDDPTVLQLIAEFLRSKGCNVECCEDAHQGMDALHLRHFDLVVTDVKMAGMNGFEFLKMARASWPKIAIIVMTAYDDDYPLSQALRAGADGYLSKPFSLSKFSLIFEKAYWNALSRQDWWEEHA